MLVAELQISAHIAYLAMQSELTCRDLPLVVMRDRQPHTSPRCRCALDGADVFLPAGASWNAIEAWNDAAHIYYEELPMQGRKKRRVLGPRVVR